jgi:hypothetical protein
MVMRPILSSVTLVALILTFLFVGCAKEEPPPPTVEPPPRPAAPPPPPPSPPPPPPGPSISQQAFQEQPGMRSSSFQGIPVAVRWFKPAPSRLYWFPWTHPTKVESLGPGIICPDLPREAIPQAAVLAD